MGKSRRKNHFMPISSTEVLYRSSADPINDPINDLLNDPIYFKPPFLIFALLLAVELFLLLLSGIKKQGWITKTLGSYEYLLVLVNFLFGALLFFLWFISDHTAAKWNLNILWCTPLSLFYLLTFFLKGAGQIVFKWVSLFLTFTSFMFLLVLVAGLQTTAISLIPLLVLYIIIFGRRIFILS